MPQHMIHIIFILIISFSESSQMGAELSWKRPLLTDHKCFIIMKMKMVRHTEIQVNCTSEQCLYFFSGTLAPSSGPIRFSFHAECIIMLNCPGYTFIFFFSYCNTHITHLIQDINGLKNQMINREREKGFVQHTLMVLRFVPLEEPVKSLVGTQNREFSFPHEEYSFLKSLISITLNHPKFKLTIVLHILACYQLPKHRLCYSNFQTILVRW